MDVISSTARPVLPDCDPQQPLTPMTVSCTFVIALDYQKNYITCISVCDGRSEKKYIACNCMCDVRTKTITSHAISSVAEKAKQVYHMQLNCMIVWWMNKKKCNYMNVMRTNKYISQFNEEPKKLISDAIQLHVWWKNEEHYITRNSVACVMEEQRTLYYTQFSCMCDGRTKNIILHVIQLHVWWKNEEHYITRNSIACMMEDAKISYHFACNSYHEIRLVVEEKGVLLNPYHGIFFMDFMNLK